MAKFQLPSWPLTLYYDLVIKEEENNPQIEGETSEETPTHGFWESWKIELEPWLLYGVFLIVVFIFGYLSGCDVSRARII